jgi:hypothetical protein
MLSVYRGEFLNLGIRFFYTETRVSVIEMSERPRTPGEILPDGNPKTFLYCMEAHCLKARAS